MRKNKGVKLYEDGKIFIKWWNFFKMAESFKVLGIIKKIKRKRRKEMR